VERDDLFTTNSKSAEKFPVRLIKRGETPPSNDGVAPRPTTNGSTEAAPLVAAETKDEFAEPFHPLDFTQNSHRIHYSESTADVEIPRHILQLNFADQANFNESKIRNFAASRFNAELRFDSSNILLIFQSCNAAAKALEYDPFKEQFNATLEAWSPHFFPTSMF
jgi:hypothetical protein